MLLLQNCGILLSQSCCWIAGTDYYMYFNPIVLCTVTAVFKIINRLVNKFYSFIFFYLLPGSPAGDYSLHHVCACVTQFSLKLLQLHILGKLLVLMNFYALQYFWVR